MHRVDIVCRKSVGHEEWNDDNGCGVCECVHAIPIINRTIAIFFIVGRKYTIPIINRTITIFFIVRRKYTISVIRRTIAISVIRGRIRRR